MGCMTILLTVLMTHTVFDLESFLLPFHAINL